MQFTKRDSVIIIFLARHKFATATQIAKYVSMSDKSAYRRLKKLVESGYLTNRRIFIQQPGVYLPTASGIDAAGCGIRPRREIALGTYFHDLEVVNIALKFYAKGYEIETEKEIIAKQNRGIGQIGKKERVPDLVLHKNNEKIAIEYEKAIKSPGRMKTILNYYARQRNYTRVIFYCEKDVVFKRVEEYSRKTDHIKTFKYEGGLKSDAAANSG